MRRSSLTKLATMAACLGAAALPSGALATTPGTWSPLASEGQSFSVPGSSPMKVRYGTDDHYVDAVVRGPGQCTNGFFGVNPHEGEPKKCTLDRATSYTAFVQQGQSFFALFPITVAYASPGQQGLYQQATVQGNAACNNWYFDPEMGLDYYHQYAANPPANCWVAVQERPLASRILNQGPSGYDLPLNYGPVGPVMEP
jgi:hypothetical protein